MSNILSKRKQDYKQQSEILYKRIGNRIQEWRKKSGKTQLQFYNFLFPEKEYQVHSDEQKTDFIHDMEYGSESELTIAALANIAKKCHVSLDWLINGESFENAEPSTASTISSETKTGVSDPDTPTEKPIDEFMALTPRDICKALVALSRICDIKYLGKSKFEKETFYQKYRFEISPKTIWGPVFVHNGLNENTIAFKNKLYANILHENVNSDIVIQNFLGGMIIEFLMRLLELNNCYQSSSVNSHKKVFCLSNH